MYHKIHP